MKKLQTKIKDILKTLRPITAPESKMFYFLLALHLVIFIVNIVVKQYFVSAWVAIATMYMYMGELRQNMLNKLMRDHIDLHEAYENNVGEFEKLMGFLEDAKIVKSHKVKRTVVN